MPETRDAFVDLPILREVRDDLQRAWLAQESRARVAPGSRVRAWRGRRAATVAVPGLAGLAAVAALAATGSLGAHRSRVKPTGARTHARVAVAPAAPAGGTLQLADYTFHLPAGYAPSAARCASIGGSAGSAAASDGGACVAVALTSGGARTVPAGAQPVTVGPYQGELSAPAGGEVDLDVTIPAAAGDRDLVFVAHGLTGPALVRIAASGLPTAIGSVTSCSADCG